MKRIFLILFMLPTLVWAQYRVPLIESTGGAKYIIIYIDGVKVKCAFDTGCTGLSTNQTIFSTLQQRGVVKKSDLSEAVDSEMANGETHLVHQYLVSNVQIGSCVLKNIYASVGFNDRHDATPLLGQAVLSRMESYTIHDGYLEFVPRSEAEQHALFIAEKYRQDTTILHNMEVVSALRPYYSKLNARYLMLFAQASVMAEQYADAIAAYQSLMAVDEDEADEIHQSILQAKERLADQYYETGQYNDCVNLFQETAEEAKQYPEMKEIVEYAYYSLFFAYWKMEQYEAAIDYALRFAQLMIAPKSLSYLQHNRILTDERVGAVLQHCSKYYLNKGESALAQKYRQMAINAGYND